MNVAICDNEGHTRSFIRRLVQSQQASCQIQEFSSGQKLLQAMDGAEEWPDILFLGMDGKDVKDGTDRMDGRNARDGMDRMDGRNAKDGTDRMDGRDARDGTGNIAGRDSIDGLSVAHRLRERLWERQEPVWGSLPLLIFVTGHLEYMREAFEVNAFQVLMKPLQEAEFRKVFAQAAQEYGRLAAQRPRKHKEILVRSQNTTRNVRAEDIYYVESSNRKVILCLEREKLEYYDKISDLELELGEGFFRIHRGFLVNMRYVEQYSRTEVRMKNGDALLISKYKYQDFAKAYLKYVSIENAG